MTERPGLRDLAVLTVTDPAAAGRVLLAVRPDSGTLWTALFLVAVLNAILFALSNMIVPMPEDVPVLISSPMIYLGIVLAGLVATVYALLWTGRGLGGRGELASILVLVVWLQALRVGVQAVALVLLLISPALSAILVFAAGLAGVWILLNFINVAHEFGSLGRSAGVLIAALLAMVLALSMVLALVGGPITGSTGYV